MGKEKRKYKDKDKRRSKNKEKERKSKEKLLRTATETPEERALRRLEKKRRKHGKAANTSIAGYTNDDNPFGDSRLTEKFVWGKRNDKLRSEGKVVKDKKNSSKDRERREREIQELKKARAEREAEQEAWEEEKMRMLRDQEAMNNAEWEKKEEEFHKKTNLMRSEIRIKEGRPRPIDLLAKNLVVEQEIEFDTDIEDPDAIFRALTDEEFRELRDDVAAYRDNDPATEFWAELLIVCEDEMEKRDISLGEDGGVGGTARRGLTSVHDSVLDEIEDKLEGKSVATLSEMEERVNTMLASDDVVDAEYWDTLLKRLAVHKARAHIHELHRASVDFITSKMREKMEAAEKDKGKGEATTVSAGRADPEDAIREMRKRKEQQEREDKQRKALRELREGEEDGTEDVEVAIEEEFGDEVKLDSEVYWWQDRYRPRKPRYFNRVHTGYEWNQYNRSHYDGDNPPPKVVQGYKFNIFYPDLIDPTKTPQYQVKKMPEDGPGITTIRFSAGPPYEDIAFKIVDREWEYSHRRGFKCSFERGVLHLYFRYRRYRYRR